MEDLELSEIINSCFPLTLEQCNEEDLYSNPIFKHSEINIEDLFDFSDNIEERNDGFQSFLEFNAEIEEPDPLSSIYALENGEERLKQNELIQIGALKSPPGRDLTQNSNSKGVKRDLTKDFRYPVNSRKRKQDVKTFTSNELNDVISGYDGYKWHKYGEKRVRGNTFPRSYYRCSKETCGVRKRTERFESDPNTSVITYDGEHNHDSCPILGNVFYFVSDPNVEAILLKMDDSDRIKDSKTSGGLLEDVVLGFLK